MSANKLIPEVGAIWKVNNVEEVKEFPVAPIQPEYLQMLGLIENEMKNLLGVSDVMQGQSAGRADSPDTYSKLIEQGGNSVIDDADLLEQSIQEWALIAMWFMQTYYTHEHMVEVETPDGQSTWKAASALAVRGEYALTIETGTMVSMSESAQFERASQYAAQGIYPLPMLAKMGHVPFWKRALKMKMAIMGNPQWASALLGGSGAPPATVNTTQRAMAHNTKRSHHRPGGS
jgi:hypothetical protein